MEKTIQQLAMDSSYTPKKLDITFNEDSQTGRTQTLAVDSKILVDTLRRSNPEGVRTKSSAYGMRFPNNATPIFLDGSDEANSLRNKLELALDDTYEYNIPSNGVPNVLTTVWTTKFIKQLFQSTPFREMTTPDQQGMFGTTDVRYPLIGASGRSRPYSDHSNDGNTSINLNYLNRQTIALERLITYGDMQQAVMGMAKVDYIGWLREYIATLITLDQNNIGFNGYEGMQCFGLLNDPTLNPALTAGTGQWMDVGATYESVIADIITTVQSIQTVGAGQVDPANSEFIIGLPPVVFGALLYQNTFGMNVRQYIESVYPKAKFIQVQNYTGTGTPLGSVAPNYMQVIFKEIGGIETALGVFSTLYNSHGVVRLASSYDEKVSYVIAGTVVTMPAGIATMSGI